MFISREMFQMAPARLIGLNRREAELTEITVLKEASDVM